MHSTEYFEFTRDPLRKPLIFSTKLYGRKRELQRLGEVLNSEEKSNQLVLLRGPSGVGKTALMQHFRQQQQAQSAKAVFLYGKLEEFRHEAVSGIRGALASYLQQELILSRDEAEEEKTLLLHRLWNVVQSHPILLEALPVLQELFPGFHNTDFHDETQNKAASEDGQMLHVKNRAPSFPDTTTDAPPLALARTTLSQQLTHAYQCLVEALCSQKGTMVMLLDDLQWADKDELQLLTALVTATTGSSDNDPRQRKNAPIDTVEQPTDSADVLSSEEEYQPRLLIAGTFREGLVPLSHPLMTHVVDVLKQQRQSNQGSKVEILSLDNLALDELQAFVANTLQREQNEEDEDLLAFCRLLLRKTGGNMFHVRQGLLFLYDRNLIRYSLRHGRWEWGDAAKKTNRLDRIDQEMAITGSVVRVVLAKLETLPSDLRYTLSVMAMIRSKCDLSLLQLIMDQSISGSRVLSMLDLAATEGILVKSNTESLQFTFVHDRIQQVVLESLEDEERDKIALLVGDKLLRFFRKTNSTKPTHENTSTWMLFVAVDRLNSLPLDCADIDPLDHAQLNYTAAQHSVAISAFQPASRYLRRALQELKRERDGPVLWKLHYEFCIRLFSTAASVELCQGNFAEGKELSDQVIAFAKTLEQKLPMYIALADGLGSQNRHDDSLVQLEIALKMLGENPRWCLIPILVSDLAYLKRAFKKLSDREVLSLPIIKDTRKVATIDVYNRAIIRSLSTRQPLFMMRCMARAVRFALEHGLTDTVAVIFAAYALVLSCVIGDHERGQRMAHLAREILKKFESTRQVAGVNMYLINTVDVWSKPLPQVLGKCLQGYEYGMQSGEFEQGLLCFCTYSMMSFAAGLSLNPLEKDVMGLCEQVNLYRYEGISCMLNYFRELVEELHGSASDPLNWMSQDDAVAMPSSKSKAAAENNGLRWSTFCRMICAYFFDEVELADKLRERFLIYSKTDPGYVIVVVGCFFSCLVSLRMAQRTGKRKHRRAANQQRKRMKGFLLHKGLNIVNRYYLLEAEYSSTFPGRKSFGTIRHEFDKAISTSLRIGDMQDAALGNELAGRYALRAKNNFWAENYFTSAYKLYVSWGANAKAAHLLSEHEAWITLPEETSNREFLVKRKSRQTLLKDSATRNSTINLESFSSDAEENIYVC